MRNANGTGNIYFDQLFKDGIPIESIIFYAIHGFISIVNLILVPIICYSASLNKSHHRNLRLVLSNLYIAFFFTSLGNLIYTTLVLTRISDIKYDPVFAWSRFMAGLGPGIWRSTFLAIVLERLAATVFYRSYEKKAPLLLGIVLFIFGELGVCIPVLYLFIRLPVFVIIIFVGSTDVISVLAMFLLYWSNQSMMKLKFDATIDLSHRYQVIVWKNNFSTGIHFFKFPLSENVRVVQIMAPVIFVGTAFDIAATLSTMVQTFIDFNTQLTSPFYLFITNLYVTFGFFLYLYRDKRTRRKIISIFYKNSRVAPEKPFIVQNIHGKKLIIEETPEIHFKNLQTAWK